MLHEMLHAYFLIYTCKQDAELATKHEMSQAHHISFVAAARALESTFKIGKWGWPSSDAFPFLIAELRYSRLMIFECFMEDVRCGYNIPNDVELRRLGLDIWRIRRELAYNRKSRKSLNGELPRYLKGNSCVGSHQTLDLWEKECNGGNKGH